MGTLGIVYGYTMFLERAKLRVTMRNRHRVLDIGSVFELFYELTSTKKMRAEWSSVWRVSRGVSKIIRPLAMLGV